MRSEAEANDVAKLIAPVITRFISSRVANKAVTEDLVQETVSRVVEVAPMLEAETMIGYAVASARNAVAQSYRSKAREAAAYHRARPTISTVESAETTILANEERRALIVALDQLTEGDRTLMLAHHMDGTDVIDLASEESVSAGSLAVRLSRVRARMRVDYLLAFRNLDLPTNSCRPVLLALSTADRRRQRALGSAEHLERCDVCALIAPALLQRDRGLAAFAPFAIAGIAMKHVALMTKAHPLVAASGTTVTAAAVAGLVIVSSGSPSATVPVTTVTATTAVVPSDDCSQVLTIGQRHPSSTDTAVPTRVGDSVTATNANIYLAGTSEGFWIGCGGYRLWADLNGQALPKGKIVSLLGTIDSNKAGYARDMNIPSETLQELLTNSAYHVNVTKIVPTP